MMFGAAYPLSEILAGLAGNVGWLAPELALVASFLLGIVAEIWPGKRFRAAVPWIAFTGTLLAGFLAALQLVPGHEADRLGLFMGMVSADRFAAIFKVMVVVPALLSILASMRSTKLKSESTGTGEYYLMLLAMLVGLFFLGMARHLLMVFLALEMVSLPSYVLTAYTRLNKKSAEASLKYVIYGCFSSGLMLYGLSWIYGLCGTLDPFAPEFISGLAAAPALAQVFPLVLVLAGLSFKIGVLPFHFWVPDVYEGAPYPVAAFFSVAPKAAGFAALLRFSTVFMDERMEGLQGKITLILAVMALGSMVVGNLSALRQQNFRRLLGYSSIAQAGYMLAGLACLSVEGHSAVAFYLLIYTLMTYGSFMLAGWMNERLGSEQIDDLKGLAGSVPIIAVMFSILMVSLTGLPPTAGFIAKLQVLLALGAELKGMLSPVALVLIVGLLLNTVVSLFYYLRPAVLMIFKNPSLISVPALHAWQQATLGGICLALVWLGIISFDGLFNLIQEIVQEMAGQIRF